MYLHDQYLKWLLEQYHLSLYTLIHKDISCQVNNDTWTPHSYMYQQGACTRGGLKGDIRFAICYMVQKLL